MSPAFGRLGILGIGADAIKYPLQVGGQVAFHLAIKEVPLGAVDRSCRGAASAESARILGKVDLRRYAARLRCCQGWCRRHFRQHRARAQRACAEEVEPPSFSGSCPVPAPLPIPHSPVCRIQKLRTTLVKPCDAAGLPIR